MSTIEVQFDDGEVKQMLASALAALGDLEPAMKNIGQFVVEATLDRFQEQRAPDGRAWAPLHPQTWARKKTKMILIEQGERGGLINSINARPTGTSVTIGTNKPYAAILHFGGQTRAHLIRPRNKKALAWPGGRHPVKEVHHPGSRFPPRPFLGVSEPDKTEIMHIISEFMGFSV